MVADASCSLRCARRGPTKARVERGLLAHPRIVMTESPIRTQHVRRFRVDAPDDLDDTLQGWLAEAYVLGSGRG